MIFVAILVMCATAVPVASEHGNCDAEEEVDTCNHWGGWCGEWSIAEKSRKSTRIRLQNIKNAVGLSEVCGTRNNRTCTPGLECQGYAGTFNNMTKGGTKIFGYDVIRGTCQPERKLNYSCGLVSAGRLNEEHKVFTGTCETGLVCKNNTCVTMGNPWLWHEGQYCMPANAQKDEVYNENLGYSLKEAQDVCASALHKKKGAYATLIYKANHLSCYLHESCVYNNHSVVKGYYLYTTQQQACTKRTCTWQGVPCVDGWKANEEDKPHMKDDEPDGNCIYAVEDEWYQSGMWCATAVDENNVVEGRSWDWCAYCEFGNVKLKHSCCQNDFLQKERENVGKGNCGDKLGDCNIDANCHKGMVCGTNNCPVFGWGTGINQDCCYAFAGIGCADGAKTGKIVDGDYYSKEYGCCVFPFSYNNKTYYSCTTDGNKAGKPWCATHTARFPKPCYKERHYADKDQMLQYDLCT